MAPGGKGKGSGKEGAAAKGKGRGASNPNARIQNAKDLRKQFGEVQNSPDGADPAPLTVPKCVECAHCGWPVYCRDARVATRKTFEKAGITREYKDERKTDKKIEAAAAAEGGGGEEDLDLGDDDDEGDAHSEDSIGTVEALESKVEEMTERILELESFNNALENENKELAQQVEDLEEALAAAEEKIELLEESEMRWREKNSALRVQNDDLRQYINRLGNRIGDLETDMVKKLLEIRWRKESAARLERRRALMLTGMEKKMRSFEGEGLIKALFKVWQEESATQSQRRQLQDLEEKRRTEVGELRDQLGLEKHHILSLEATADRLRGSLKAAAQRLLGKVMSTTQKPWADGHVLRAWAGTHPAVKFENELIRTKQTLGETQAKLEDESQLTARLTADLELTTANLKKTSKERDELASKYAVVVTELQAILGAQGKQAADVERMAEEKAKAARDALSEEIWDEARIQMDKMNIEFASERVKYEDQIGGLEAQLESIKRGIGGGGDDTEETRVVPKGQGILCCGCLRQIVNRGVKQLPPVSLPKARSPSRNGEKAKEQMQKDFFRKELVGMPDPDDTLHSETWKARRNPMAGMRYADICPQVAWSPCGKSASLSKLKPMRVKETLSFKPTAFR